MVEWVGERRGGMARGISMGRDVLNHNISILRNLGDVGMYASYGLNLPVSK